MSTEDDINDPELSELLDCALEDFDKLTPTVPPPSKPSVSSHPPKPSASQDKNTVIANSTDSGQPSSKSSTGQPSSKSSTKPHPTSPNGPDPDSDAAKLAELFANSFGGHPSDANDEMQEEDLQKLLAMMQSSLGNLLSEDKMPSGPPSAPSGASASFSNDPIARALEGLTASLPQFQESGASMDDDSLLGAMLAPLLAKEVVYEPLKLLHDRYPEWLSLQPASPEKEARERQASLIADVIAEYESPAGDGGNLSSEQVRKVAQLLDAAMREGSPPSELIDNGAEGVLPGGDGAPPDCKGM